MSVAYHSVWIPIGSRAPDGARALTAASLAANITSLVNTAQATSLQASFTFTVESGTPTGAYIVEQTNDIRAEDPQTANSAQWNTIQSIPVTTGTFSGGGTSALVTWLNGAKYTRVRWAFTSGTGTGLAFGTGVSG